MDGKPKTCDATATSGEPNALEARTEDPHDASGRITENNASNNNASNGVSSLTTPSANSLLASTPPLTSQSATLAQMHQPQAQAPASTSTSRGTLSLDAESLLLLQQQQLQERVSGHHQLHPPIAIAQVQHATPAALPPLSLNPLSRNMAAMTHAAQAPTALSPPQYFPRPTHHTSPPTNQVQSLLHLLNTQTPPASGLAATNDPLQQDQSQLLHQLLGEIRIRIEAVAMILSQQQQASGNVNSSRLPAVSDDAINEIIAMLCRQQEARPPNPSSNALNQIASVHSWQQQQNQASGYLRRAAQASTSNEVSNFTDLNQWPPDASISQQIGAHSNTPSRVRTNHLIAQLLSQLASPGAASNRSDADSINRQIDQLLSQEIIASAQQLGVPNMPTLSASQIESSARHCADRPATAAQGGLEASAYPSLPVNQAPPSFARHPDSIIAEPSPTGISAAPHQSGLSHREDHRDERDMNPSQLQEARWMARYQELKEFKQTNGHCRVPHGCPDNPQLSWWVMNQRAQFQLMQQGKKSWLSSDRVELLNMIGFDWRSPIKPKSKNKKQQD